MLNFMLMDPVKSKLSSISTHNMLSIWKGVYWLRYCTLPGLGPCVCAQSARWSSQLVQNCSPQIWNSRLLFPFTLVVCPPCPAAFQIHLQVNTLWQAANLQPTAVVTAVQDKGPNQSLPQFSMFAVTIGKWQQTFCGFVSHWKDSLLITSLTSYPCVSWKVVLGD